MVLEQLERVQAQLGLRDLEGLLEDVGGFVLDEEKVAMGFVLADLLHDAEEVDGGEEVAPREFGDGFVWVRGLCCWIAKFVELGAFALAGVLTFLECEGWKFVF